MFVNYKIPKRENMEEAATTGTLVVATGVRIAIDPGKGELILKANAGFELDFVPSTPAPKWFELAISLPWEQWRNCREIFLRYKASGSEIEVQPALRLGNTNDFHDHFSKETHLVGEETTEYGAAFVVSPRLAKAATWMDLHLFFTPKEGRFGLLDLCVTGVR